MKEKFFGKFSIFALSLTILVSSALAGNNDYKIYDDFLSWVENEFDELNEEEKVSLLYRPLNLSILIKAKSISELDWESLEKKVGPDPFRFEIIENNEVEYFFNTNKTNALMIAIDLADVEKLNKFLNYISNINDPILSAWGYRQPYSPAHMAIDPQISRNRKNTPLYKRLKVIQLLAEKGADFNTIFEHSYIGIYTNPPLISAHEYGDNEQLIAEALLYGANPTIKGSSTMLSYDKEGEQVLSYYAEKIVEKAFNRYMEMTIDERKRTNIAPIVREKFASIRDYKTKQLTDLEF